MENNADPPPYEAKNGGIPPKGSNSDPEDPWKVVLPELDEKKWSEMSCDERLNKVTWIILRVIILLITLYLFVCSLSFLSTAFRLIGGFAAGSILSNHSLLGNPVAGLMIGVLVTVLVQSSSTSTSIIVAMVGANIVGVHEAIPVVMGANIGTSVTNTIVALGQAKERNEFRRAFGGATVHDMFNWLTVIVLLPMEVITGYLEALSDWIVGGIKEGDGEVEVEILKVITDPFTKWVIQIDKGVIGDVAEGLISSNDTGVRILKVCPLPTAEDCYAAVKSDNSTKYKFHWFWRTGMSDSVTGLIVLVASVLLLLICLIVIVKILHSLLRGHIARIVHKVVNSDFPSPFGYFTGYLAILAGAICTFIVQSSSIFTSAITPLVGVGVISLERMYPLTLGANIGTTATGLIAALAVDGNFRNALQLAFCHLFFNISGIIIWYPIPYIRFPIPLAKCLGNTTAKYRWFAVVYLILAFFVFPAIVFGLSAIGENGVVLMAVGIPFLLLVIAIVIINILQRKFPTFIENSMFRDWNWLPKFLHSLEPWDSIFTQVFSCGFMKQGNKDDRFELSGGQTGVQTNGAQNPGYEKE